MHHSRKRKLATTVIRLNGCGGIWCGRIVPRVHAPLDPSFGPVEGLRLYSHGSGAESRAVEGGTREANGATFLKLTSART